MALRIPAEQLGVDAVTMTVPSGARQRRWSERVRLISQPARRAARATARKDSGMRGRAAVTSAHPIARSLPTR
jgi:hypothetical protein